MANSNDKVVWIGEPKLVGDTIKGTCTVLYGPTQFRVDQVEVDIDWSASPGTINDQFQQKAMDTINADVPGAVSSKNEIRVVSAVTK